jgi:hypothetical protein
VSWKSCFSTTPPKACLSKTHFVFSQCDHTFCEKSAQFCPNIAQNGSLTMWIRIFARINFFDFPESRFRKGNFGQLFKRCANLSGHIFQLKKIRPRQKNSPEFRPVCSYCFLLTNVYTYISLQ